MRKKDTLPEWQGGDVTGRVIMIRRNIYRDRIGEDIRLARFVGQIAPKAKRCIVLAEPRMVPLLSRTFSDADVRDAPGDDVAGSAQVDVAASYGMLGYQFARTPEALSQSLVPLRPDSVLKADIRSRYAVGQSGPLVGIAWWSRNTNRDLPNVADWQPLLAGHRATWASLQYQPSERDLELVGTMADGKFFHDYAIDQIASVDQFAAQIAALDAVVSITNTTIDMAASLEIPTI